MPIRPELRPLYPPNWPQLSNHVRFVRGKGRCQDCGRKHLAEIRCMPDGRWYDADSGTWLGRYGRPARWPDLVETAVQRTTRVVLAAAHLDGNPRNNRLSNLKSFCQRCHLKHDRRQHVRARWLTYRRRYAMGDLFLGRYEDLVAAVPAAPGPRPRLQLPLKQGGHPQRPTIVWRGEHLTVHVGALDLGVTSARRRRQAAA